MVFKASYIPEPKLKFLNGEAYNPCIGLLNFGPRFSTIEETGHKWIKVGIIGSGSSISAVLNLLEEIRNPYVPKKMNKWNLPFPGLNEGSSLNCSISVKPEWQQKINSEEITQILREDKRNKKVNRLLNLIDTKIKTLYEKSPPPDVIIISIPKELEDACKDPRFDKPLLKSENNDDFHNSIKLSGMKYKIPTQLIRPDTLEFSDTQEKNIVLWNLSVGLIYKSQKGYPWKLAELEDNTCYLGVSFFKENDPKNKYLRASMTQIFLDTGESFILRGEPFEWKSKKEKNPHLSTECAEKLIKQVLAQYKEIKGTLPSRIVIHKSSNYWQDEIDGFLNATRSISSKDFITIQPSNIKFYREKEYGVLRGTLIASDSDKEYYLFTTGFVPCLNTYPGFGVPKPLLIRLAKQDSDIKKICQEILSFTKLDWNNTFIYRKEPVTISVSRKVGRVLAESNANSMTSLDPHYYYYM